MFATKQGGILLVPADTIDYDSYQKYWGLSREDGMFGFVGGKLHLGENILQTVVREVEEELGVRIKETDMLPINSRWVNNHWVTVFLCTKAVPENQLQLEPGVTARKVSLDEMCLPILSPFWDYNCAIRDSVALYTSQARDSNTLLLA